MKIKNFQLKLSPLNGVIYIEFLAEKQVVREKEKINMKNMRMKKGSFMHYQLNMQNSSICRFFQSNTFSLMEFIFSKS